MRRFARPIAFCLPLLLAATSGAAATLKAPAPDPLASMPGEISAILDVTSAPRVLLMQDEHGTPFPRELKVGDVYRDGWTVASISGQTVTLKKGAQQRAISPRARPVPAAPVTVATIVPTAPVAPLTGAALGEPRNAGGPGGRGGRGGGFGGGQGGRGAAGAQAAGGFATSNAAPGAGGRARIFQGLPAGAAPGAQGIGGMQDLAAMMNNPQAQAAVMQQLQASGQLTPEMMQMMQQFGGGGRAFTVGPNGAPAVVAPPQRPQVIQGAPNFLTAPAVR